jgi:hypothetical protein
LKWILAAMAALFLIMVFKIVGIFFLSREARVLHLAMNDATEWVAQPHIRFSVGPGLLTMGRLAATFIDDLPPEAASGLDAVRRASVGIYRFERSPGADARMAMIASSDETMAARGWQRIVTVSENDSTVLIYMPEGWEDEQKIDLCLAVCDGEELIVVSAVLETEPLLELVQSHMPRQLSI